VGSADYRAGVGRHDAVLQSTGLDRSLHECSIHIKLNTVLLLLLLVLLLASFVLLMVVLLF